MVTVPVFVQPGSAVSTASVVSPITRKVPESEIAPTSQTLSLSTLLLPLPVRSMISIHRPQYLQSTPSRSAASLMPRKISSFNGMPAKRLRSAISASSAPGA